MNHYEKEVARLQKALNEAKTLSEQYEEAVGKIQIGVRIMDLDSNRVMVVDRLKNGSNDFEATPVEGGLGRGYHYLVNNWEVVKDTEQLSVSQN